MNISKTCYKMPNKCTKNNCKLRHKGHSPSECSPWTSVHHTESWRGLEG
jgi:hypothetical protein